jgi:hypothetical protein
MKLQTSQTSLFPPLNPPLQPQQAVGATGPQITEANRLHLELKQTFQTYQAVDQALRNLILHWSNLVPPRWQHRWEDFGIHTFVGNQTTVSAMRSDVFSRIQTQ